MISVSNDLNFRLYDRESTTPVSNLAGALDEIVVEYFDTVYQGGLYGVAALKATRSATDTTVFKRGQRLVIKNGLRVIYEGEQLNAVVTIDQNDEGQALDFVGLYDSVLRGNQLDKPWSDSRLSDSVWIEDETASAFSKATLDRRDRLRITPKSEAWTNGEVFTVTYTAPTGQTIKKITYDYDLQEAAQSWEIDFYDATNGANSIATSSGTGAAQTYTLGTPVQSIQFRLIARAGQTPTADGTYYGEISSLFMQTETSSITLEEIAKDVRASNASLNSDESRIGTAALGIAPFVTAGPRSHADILSAAARFGDSSQNSYNVYLRESDYAVAPDGLPVLVVEQYPALTGHDYAARLDEGNLTMPFKLVKDEAVFNYITVQYKNNLGQVVYVTPDDDSNLTDSDSVAEYGQRRPPRILDAGETSEANAIAYGRRFLAYHKDPKYTVVGPIRVTGWIRDGDGLTVPACRIQAGKRILIENFFDDVSRSDETGLTFLIYRTRYVPESETASLYTGVEPSDLATMMAQIDSGII